MLVCFAIAPAPRDALRPAVTAPESSPADAGASLLAVAGAHKHFGGVHALRGASIDVRSGEVHALGGENGAGKSTLTNILAGAVRRDAGSIVFDGTDVDFRSPAESQRHGIA